MFRCKSDISIIGTKGVSKCKLYIYCLVISFISYCFKEYCFKSAFDKEDINISGSALPAALMALTGRKRHQDDSKKVSHSLTQIYCYRYSNSKKLERPIVEDMNTSYLLC